MRTRRFDSPIDEQFVIRDSKMLEDVFDDAEAAAKWEAETAVEKEKPSWRLKSLPIPKSFVRAEKKKEMRDNKPTGRKDRRCGKRASMMGGWKGVFRRMSLVMLKDAGKKKSPLEGTEGRL